MNAPTNRIRLMDCELREQKIEYELIRVDECD